MPRRLAGRDVEVSENSEAQTGDDNPAIPGALERLGIDWRTFRAPAPSWDLIDWLWNLIPPGAPVIPVGTAAPDGMKDSRLDTFRPVGLPCIRLAASPPIVGFREHWTEQIAERMPATYARAPGRQAPRKGIKLWQMEAAVYRDLVGSGTAEIADVLDLRDDSTRGAENGSRSARRYVEAGRRQLVALGAWPWALQPLDDGVLPRGWHRAEHFATALAHWHYYATRETLQDCLRRVERAAGSTDLGVTLTTVEQAATAYINTYRAQLAKTPPEDD